jgi:hypothetical protein
MHLWKGNDLIVGHGMTFDVGPFMIFLHQPTEQTDKAIAQRGTQARGRVDYCIRYPLDSFIRNCRLSRAYFSRAVQGHEFRIRRAKVSGAL